MLLKTVMLFLLLQAFVVNSTMSRHRFLRDQQDVPSVRMSRNRIRNNRTRRCLSTALSMLWPQVVGPVDQGIIKEVGYDELPKTLLEYRLDMIREKTRQEEENRLIVRDYLKKLTETQDKFYGFPDNQYWLKDYT